jgi:hypothetical protein
MYTITAGTDGVVFGCMDCAYSVRVNDYKHRLGHPRTQAANAINDHLRTQHRVARVPPMPRHRMMASHQ